MAQQFLGEIRCFGFNFQPFGWALCDGRLLQISQNTALFSLIGTFYGGNGTTTFGLPDLRSRAPMHWGNQGGFSGSTVIGEAQGTETVTLISGQLPVHTHAVTTEFLPPGGAAQRVATATSSASIGTSYPNAIYKASSPTPDTAFANSTIGVAGGSQPHDNMQPYLTLNFCIALTGVFPARN